MELGVKGAEEQDNLLTDADYAVLRQQASMQKAQSALVQENMNVANAEELILGRDKVLSAVEFKACMQSSSSE